MHQQRVVEVEDVVRPHSASEREGHLVVHFRVHVDLDGRGKTKEREVRFKGLLQRYTHWFDLLVCG